MRSRNPHRIAITAWTSVIVAAVGCAVAVIGPTLLDLAARIAVENDVLASIFPVRAVGAFLGTAASGFVFDRLQRYSYVMLAALIAISTIVVCVVPFSVHIAMMGVVFFFFGFFIMGSLVNGTQSVLLKATQKLKRASSYILFLHFSFAVGATISPLWARPFVSKETTLPSNISCLDLGSTVPNNSTSCDLALRRLCSDPLSYVTLEELKLSTCVDVASGSALRFGWAYWLCAPVFIMALVAFVTYSVRYEFSGRCVRTNYTLVNNQDEQRSQSQPKVYFLSTQTLPYKVTFYILISVFTYTYLGIEAYFSNYIFTYAVESGALTKAEATVLNSVFWGSFALFRFLAIVIALFGVPTTVQIMANIVVGFLASLMISIFPRQVIVLWLGTALLGAGMSSTFPSIIAWLAQQTEVSGKTSALLICTGTLADMTMPITIATLITKVSPVTFVYFTTANYSVTLMLAMVLFGFVWLRKRFSRRGKDKEGGAVVGYCDKEGGAVVGYCDKEGGAVVGNCDKEGGAVVGNCDKEGGAIGDNIDQVQLQSVSSNGDCCNNDGDDHGPLSYVDKGQVEGRHSINESPCQDTQM